MDVFHRGDMGQLMTQTKAAPVTMKQLADALGVDRSTVSLVLSGKGRVSTETRTRILALANELGYEPDVKAQRLVSHSTNNLVCLFSGTSGLGLATEKMMLIQEALNEEGLEVPFYTASKLSGKNPDLQIALIKQIRRQRPKAIICSAYMLMPEVFQELALYQRQGGIVVSYDLPIPLECDQVVFDREHNAYQAAHYLLERGHKKLGIGMSHPSMTVSDTVGVTQSLRPQGFKRALAEYGLPMHDEWLFEWLFEGNTFEAGGIAMAQHFLSLRERPSCVCIVNDYVALAFMREVMRNGLEVPRDVSIMGHDNQTASAYSAVPMTSVSQPVEEIAQAVVSLVIERLNGSIVPHKTITLQGKLVERQSVASPAN